MRGRRLLGEPHLIELRASQVDANDELPGCLAHERRRPAASIVQHLVQEQVIRVLGYDLEVDARDVAVTLQSRTSPVLILSPSSFRSNVCSNATGSHHQSAALHRAVKG